MIFYHSSSNCSNFTFKLSVALSIKINDISFNAAKYQMSTFYSVMFNANNKIKLFS